MPLPPSAVNFDPYYEGMTTLEMVQTVRHRLGVAPADETRYPTADVIQGLNQGCLRFVKLTGCLFYPAVVLCKANQMTYRAPYGTLRIKAGRFYTGPGRQDYDELKIIRDMRQMQRLDSEFRGNPGQPEWLFPAYRTGSVLTFGLSPYPSVDGELWTASDYGLVATATGYQNAGNIQGMHKDGYTSSAFLVDDAGRDMVALGALVGYPVYNVTTGQSGVITAIGDQDATNDKVTATLSGGGVWSPGDVSAIPMGEFGVVADGNQEIYTLSSFFGTVGDLVGNTGNLVLDCVRRPLPLSANLLDAICEIPVAFQEAPIAYATYWLGSGMFGGLVQNSKAAASLGLFQGYVDEYNSSEDLIEESESAVEGSDWWD